MATIQQLTLTLCLTFTVLSLVPAEIVFDVSPQPLAVLTGYDVTLDCVARETNGLPLQYRWEFDSAPTTLPLLPNNSLFISQITQLQLGSYQCLVQVINQTTTARSTVASIVEAYLEAFYLQPQPVTAVAGNETTFECVTGRSAPPPIVYWQKDGQRFTQGEEESGTFGEVGRGGAVQISTRLVIKATVDKAGVYRCVAENPLKKEVQYSRTATLTITVVPESPSIVTSPQANLIAPATVALTLDCGVKGHPSPDVRWYHDGGYIVNSSRIFTLENGTLHIENLREDDQGIYFCEAENEIGQTRSHNINVTVAVLDIPFVLNPSGVNVLAGQEVTLQCIPPRSVPRVSTVWYKDTLPFTQRTGEFEARRLDNGALYFRNIQIMDEGQYFCVAVNDYAVPKTRTSEKALVTVEASPLIVEPPVPTRVMLSQLLTLKCRVEGRPTPDLKWYKDNEELEEGGRLTIRDSGMELLIHDVIKDDEGSYTCTASNRHGLVTSAPVLAFIIVPPEITNPPEDTAVREGSDVLVPCRVYGDPRPTVTWYKDGKELAAGGDITIDDKGMRIRSVNKGDEGTYHCKATNEGGTKQAEGLLRIQVVPELTVSPSDTSVVEGQPLILYCDDREAFPTPTFYWKFNGSRSLPREMVVDDDGRRLEVTSAQRNHTGSYMCVAENTAGLDTKTVNILVQVPPSILSIAGDLDLEQGHDLYLTCKVEGVPRPSILWSVRGKTIIPTSDGRVSFPQFNSLLIQYARGEDSGEYKCTAENDAGVAKQAAQVFVKETPFPPKILSVRPVSMTSVNVTWEPVAQDPNNVVDAWVLQYKQTQSAIYIVYKDDVAASLTSFEVAGLLPYTEYVFRVAARNTVGVGRYSESLAVRTLETAPSAPRNLQMLSHNASSISLRWELPAQTNGEIRAYQVHYRVTHGDQEYTIETISTPSKTLQYYTLSGLDPYTTYSVKVRGATIEGGVHLWGEFSHVVNITTSTIPPSKAPSDVKVRVTSSRSLHVTWKPVPPAFHHGPLIGYVVQYRRHDVINEPYFNMTTASTVTETEVTSLLPWRKYDVRLRGYNLKGYGMASDDVTVRTTAEVPTGHPTEVTASALSSTSITVSWKPVPVEERDSLLSGYVVEYRLVGAMETDTLSQDVGDPNLTQLNIIGLQPYTDYIVRVHAFTTQVTNGFGPNSPEVRVRTAEGIPGPVSNLTIYGNITAVYISWDPPVTPNGVIENYHVIYTIPTSPPAVDTGGSRSRRAVGNAISNNTWEIITNDTEVTVTGLIPDTTYAFHVVAETGAGLGKLPDEPVASINFPRAPTSTTQRTTSTTSLMTTTLTMAATENSTPSSTLPGEVVQNYLPIIIGTSVAGAVILAILAAVIAVCCYRHSTRKGSYFIAPQPGFSGHVNGQPNNQQVTLTANSTSTGSKSTSSGGTVVTMANGQPNSSPSTRTTTATMHSSISLREAVPGYSNSSHASRPRSEIITNSNQMLGRGIPLDPLHDLSYSSMDELRPSTLPSIHQQGAYYMPRYPGVENPGYEGDGSRDLSSVFSPHTDSTLLRNSAIYRSQQDLYAQVNLNKRRKNRMKSQTAAAIAVQKNVSSSMFLDTDALINNDSVVVYDERTAL